MMGPAAAPLLLCLLYSLTGSGDALTCQVCMSPFRNCYSDGTSMVCPTGNVCAASYTQTIIELSPVIEEFSRACAPKYQCNTTGSTSIPGGKIKRSTTCCDTDNCYPAFPVLPEDDDRKNGLICSTCVSADSDWCHTDDTMTCTGKENMCLLQSTHHYAPKEQTIAVRGCATKSFCDLGNQVVSYGNVNLTMKFKCSNGSSGLHCPLLSTIIVTLAVLKMFYW